MINHLRKLYNAMFGKPTAQAFAVNELAEAKRQLLVHQTTAEYHIHMVWFYETNIARLTAYTEESK